MSVCCRGVSMDPAGRFRSTCWRAWSTFFPAFGPAVQAALGSSFLPTYPYVQKEIYKAYKLICAICRQYHYPFTIIPPFSWPTRSNSPSFMLLSVCICSLTPSRQQMLLVGPLSEEHSVCREETCRETQFSDWNESWAPVGGLVWAKQSSVTRDPDVPLVLQGEAPALCPPCPPSWCGSSHLLQMPPTSQMSPVNKSHFQVPVPFWPLQPQSVVLTTVLHYHTHTCTHTCTCTHTDKINTPYISFT